MIFQDRRDAGRQLVPRLKGYLAQANCLVVGLARGGVVTAAEVAAALKLPLIAFVVRKIGAPSNEELALGAVAETGDTIFNQSLIAELGVSQAYLKQTMEKERKLALERSALYRGTSQAPNFKDKTVILVDDGIATGASMEAAILAMRKAHAKKIVLAVPVAAPDSLKRLGRQVDEVICLSAPESFYAVGSFYRAFEQTSDAEVTRLLVSS